ncbi:MAG: type II toxin-antitoxin system HicA family toxin [Burkholderiales bacterium]|nr:type II toxin-antitoxin system HicA family toxin [Burkholderiales bacterium]
MKLPRDLSGAELVRALAKVGCRVTRQTGSHLRLTTDSPPAHHVTVPLHDSLKVGTLAGILSDVAADLKISREELLSRLS